MGLVNPSGASSTFGTASLLASNLPNPVGADPSLVLLTDQGVMLVSDNVNWLGPEDFLPLHGVANDLAGIATSGMKLAMGQTARGVKVTQWEVTTSVATLNNGSNFWTVTLQRRDENETLLTVASFTTADDTAGVDATHLFAGTYTNNPTNPTDQRLQIRVDKTGAAGVLIIYNVVKGREVYV
jgi:hypothetical protein